MTRNTILGIMPPRRGYRKNVGNNGEAFVERPEKAVYSPWIFAIVVGWKIIIKAIFPWAIDSDLLKLVHLPNGFRMLLGQEPLNKGDVVNLHNWPLTARDSSADFYHLLWGLVENSINLDFGFISQFMYRGTQTDYENTFPSKIGTPMRVHIASSRDAAAPLSKEWFQLDAFDTESVGKTLSFCW